jgi:hypothetical protein
MKMLNICTVLSLALGISACGSSSSNQSSTMPAASVGDTGSLSIKNVSSYDVYSMQLSPFDSVDWGINLIGSDPLMHGETAAISTFECKKYDLRMVDDENVECIIQDIDLCFQDQQWAIDDTTLAICATGWAD